MNHRAVAAISTIIVGHLAVDFIVPLLMFRGSDDGEWLLALMLGFCVAQVNLIAVWAAMAPGRVMLRLPWSIFLATLMWYALVLGNRLRDWLANEWNGFGGRFRTEDAVQLGLILLTAVLVAQLPLWAASRLLRWRLLPPAHDPKVQSDERQFNLQHLLAGMLLTSFALGVGRLVLPAGAWRVGSLGPELPVLLPVVSVVNLIVVMPCIWGAFARLDRMIPLALGWLAYAVVVSVAEVAFLLAVLGAPGDDNVWALIALFNIAQCLCVFATLACLRGIGFRLARRTSAVAG